MIGNVFQRKFKSKILNDPLLRNLMNVHLFALDEIRAIFNLNVLNHWVLTTSCLFYPRLLESMESTAGRFGIPSFSRCLLTIIQMFWYFLIPHQCLFTRPRSFALFAHRSDPVNSEDSWNLCLHDKLLGLVQCFWGV